MNSTNFLETIDRNDESDSNESFLRNSPSPTNGDLVTCVPCTIHEVTQRLRQLDVTWSQVQQMSCTTSCLAMDILGGFTDSFVSFLSRSVITMETGKHMRDDLCLVLDNLGIGKFEFYLRSILSMDKFAPDDKDKLISFLNTMAYEFATSDNQGLLDTLMGRRARRSLGRFISDTSNFLSLQAFIETLTVFHGLGLAVDALIPSKFCYIIDSFASLNEEFSISNYQYHTTLSNIVRQLITDELENQIEIFELDEEKFINDDLPTGNDPFLYYRKREHSFNHLVVFGPHKYIWKLWIQR